MASKDYKLLVITSEIIKKTGFEATLPFFT